MGNMITRGIAQVGALVVGGERSSKVGGSVKVNLVAGQDETSDDTIPVTGMAVGDRIIAVLVLTTAASIATMAKKLDADVTAIAGNVQVLANKVNNAAQQYMIIWEDRT